MDRRGEAGVDVLLDNAAYGALKPLFVLGANEPKKGKQKQKRFQSDFGKPNVWAILGVKWVRARFEQCCVATSWFIRLPVSDDAGAFALEEGHQGL